MALNLDSLSITSIFNSIVNFFRSNENNTRWRSLTSTSEGAFIIRLLSNVFSAISYRIVAQSRENFLSTAALPSSNIGISINLGYSAFRGSNLKRKIKILANGDYTFPRLSVIGTYSDEYDILTLNETTLEAGEEAEVDVVVGKVKEQTVTTGTSAIRTFSLFTTGISEDYSLFLGSTEVPTTKVIKEMTEDKYLVRTNPYSSVDIIYLNTYENFKYKYGTDSELTIRYVELADVDVIPFNESMFSNYGTLQDYTLISSYIPFETVTEMKVNAPLHHELQNLIRSKSDYANRLSEIVPSVIEDSFEPLTPTYTLISYLKDNLTLLTDEEKDGVNKILLQENFFGTPLPDITHPRRAVAKLQIFLALKSKYRTISDIQIDINNILANFYNTTFGLSFSVYDLERQLESLSYVKYARVEHAINERAANTSYQLGYLIYNENNKTHYMASQILGSSGPMEPAWNVPTSNIKSIDSGLETIDGSLVWRTYKLLPNMPTNLVSVWSANAQYGIGEYVVTETYPNFMFKCVDLIKSTGSTTPDLTLALPGQFIIDGGIVWVVKTYSSDAPMWSSYSQVRLGETRNTVTSNATLSLECISYTGTVSTLPNIEFEQTDYDILSATSTTFEVEGNKTYYFRAGDIITAANREGTTTFAVTRSSYDIATNKTTITTQQYIDVNLEYTKLYTEERGTRDGQILWRVITDTNTIKYDWNVYTTFTYDLDVQ